MRSESRGQKIELTVHLFRSQDKSLDFLVAAVTIEPLESKKAEKKRPQVDWENKFNIEERRWDFQDVCLQTIAMFVFSDFIWVTFSASKLETWMFLVQTVFSSLLNVFLSLHLDQTGFLKHCGQDLRAHLLQHFCYSLKCPLLSRPLFNTSKRQTRSHFG